MNAITNPSVQTFQWSIACDQPLTSPPVEKLEMSLGEICRGSGTNHQCKTLANLPPARVARVLSFLPKNARAEALTVKTSGKANRSKVTYLLGRLTQPHCDATLTASRQSLIITGGWTIIATNKVHNKCLELVVFSFLYKKQISYVSSIAVLWLFNFFFKFVVDFFTLCAIKYTMNDISLI